MGTRGRPRMLCQRRRGRCYQLYGRLLLDWARLLWKLATSAKRWKSFPLAWKPERLHCPLTPGQLLRPTFKSPAPRQLLARLVTLRQASRLPSLCLRSAQSTSPRWSFLPTLLKRLLTLRALALILRRSLWSSRKVLLSTPRGSCPQGRHQPNWLGLKRHPRLMKPSPSLHPRLELHKPCLISLSCDILVLSYCTQDREVFIPEVLSQ